MLALNIYEMVKGKQLMSQNDKYREQLFTVH
jgi:hypothetical protein